MTAPSRLRLVRCDIMTGFLCEMPGGVLGRGVEGPGGLLTWL